MRSLFAGNFCFVLALFVFGAGCADSGAPGAQGGASGAAGSAGQSAGADASSCDGERAAFVMSVEAATSCADDADCTVYIAPCLQTESGNCAGIFYVAASSGKTIDARKADFEACAGHACGAGGACGLGPTSPKCVSGKCQ